MKNLASVKDAQVNFNSSTLVVQGTPTREELLQAGAFENLEIAHAHEEMTRIPLWKNRAASRTILSGILLAVGWVFHFVYGPSTWPVLFAYAGSILVGGYVLFLQGLRNLAVFRFDMKTLMTVAILGAAAIGEWGEGATVVFLFAISEALETFSMDKARQSIRSLMDLAPKEAVIRRRGQKMRVPVDDVQIGDIMIVKPGEKLAMDGKIVKGHSTVNEAAITGESMPVSKAKGDEVFAGTLNEEGLLEVHVTKRAEDTTIAKIIHLVEEAQEEKAPAQAFVDRFAQYYTPLVMLIALSIVLIPPLFFGGSWQDWIYRGLAMLVVACPCALVISTPVSIVTAIGTAARQGVLIKGGVYLEETGALTAVAFDKTGTLTSGKPEVTDVLSLGDQTEKGPAVRSDEGAAVSSVLHASVSHASVSHANEWLAIAAAIEKGSQHPLADAIVRKAEESNDEWRHLNADDFQSLTGKGVSAKVKGVRYFVGSPELFSNIIPEAFDDRVKERIQTLQAEGKTVMLVGTDENILGLIAARDAIRKDSKQMLEQMRQLGIQKTILLTGDNRRTAEALGSQLGIADIRAELLPEDKLHVIRKLIDEDHKVAMVGDGVNDAPALATATVGVAMGGAGTDAALETADIVLMADDLNKLPFIVRLSQKTLRIVKQNVAFSLLIKLAALLLIIPGWLTLWLAIFADMGATLLVTLNGLRLLRNGS